MPDLRLAESEGDIAAAFVAMSELRPHLSEQAFVAQVRRQQSEGFQLLVASREGLVLGCTGFWIAEKLAWGKHLYVDDLVVCHDFRNEGAGKAMLDYLEQLARTCQCISMHLDSGVQRFAAHRFYLREGYHISSHHFAKTL